MTEKRFTNHDDTILDTEGEQLISTDEIVDKMNELADENKLLKEDNDIKLEIIDAFIHGLEDEKGIDPENVEFQCKMNFTLKVLKKLKKDMLDPTQFKQLKELIE